jgi:CubicO group peptidase (beta-lactamase class C family)
VNQTGLASLLREHATRHSVPGAAIGIHRDGDTVTAYHGEADVTTGEPITPETRFGAGSLTKSMVATVIARLAEEGILTLDDAVAERVPELRASTWARHATIRDVLANRSRLPLTNKLEFGFDQRLDEDDGALARLVADVGDCPPGPDIWSYSNVGWCMLGRVIEAATGATWEQAMRRHASDMGMHETSFALDVGSTPLTSGHEVTAGGPVPVPPLVSRAYAPAGTNVQTTVTDLLRLCSLHLRDPWLAKLREAHAHVSIHGWLDAWGLGWARFDWGGSEVWGWDGLISGQRSVLRLVPEHRAAVVLLTNASTGRAMYRSLFSALTPSLFGIALPPLRLQPSAGAAGELSRYAGVYAWPDRRVVVTATVDGLFMREGKAEMRGHPVDERTFVVDPGDPDNPTVTFASFDESRRPRVMYLMIWGLPRIDGQEGTAR